MSPPDLIDWSNIGLTLKIATLSLQIKACCRTILSRDHWRQMYERFRAPPVHRDPRGHPVTAESSASMATSPLTSWSSSEVSSHSDDFYLVVFLQMFSDLKMLRFVGKISDHASFFVILLLCSPWNHTWTSRKPWTKGRKRIPRSQRRKGYVSTEQTQDSVVQEWRGGGKSDGFWCWQVTQGAQVYQDYQGHTLFKKRTECKRGRQVCVGFTCLNLFRNVWVKSTPQWALSFVLLVTSRQWTGWSPQEGSPPSWQRLTGWNTTGSCHISFFFHSSDFSCFIFRISCSRASERV